MGATPAGIAAAVAASQLGSRVALVESTSHIGGMLANGGLCYTDIWIRWTEPRFFTEFTERIRKHYAPGLHLSRSRLLESPPGSYLWMGYFWEPSLAERVLKQMVEQEQLITVLLNYRLLNASRRGRKLVAARFETPQGTVELRAKVFIDATYEGDLAAAAGAEYRLGREGRGEHNEEHAGVIYQDHVTKAIYPGSTGEGDKRLPAYTVQLIVTDNPDNQVPIERPEDYDRGRYASLLEDVQQGLVKTIGDVYRFVPAGPFAQSTDAAAPSTGSLASATRKYALNSPFKGSVSADLPGENNDYPDGDPATRQRLYLRHLNHTLGLLYFLQNDPDVPDSIRQAARRWGLAADEYPDNRHVPRWLYPREARRIVGEYVLTENDLRADPKNQIEPGSPLQVQPPWMFFGYPKIVPGISNQRPPIHTDSIAVAGYFPESRAARPWHPGHEGERHVFEGLVLLDDVFLPAQLPYRIMIPETVDGLLVPVAASATHIAFSSIRMEPTWMALGEAAGTAAHLAATNGMTPAEVSAGLLQRVLLKREQIITFFSDASLAHPHSEALQYFGTKGFFPGFTAMPERKVTWGLAMRWLSQARRRPEPEIRKTVLGSSSAEFDPERHLIRETALEWTTSVYSDRQRKLSSLKPGDWLLPQVSGLLEQRGAPVTRSEFCQLLYLMESEKD